MPTIDVVDSAADIIKLDGRKILFAQNSENKISDLKINQKERYFFIFGPEGGLTREELNLFDEKYKLVDNRLRTETAIIKCASIITI